MFLLIGLLFCGMDTLYIVHYVMRDQHGVGDSSYSLGSLLSDASGDTVEHPELDMSRITNPEVTKILSEILADPDKLPVLQLLLDAKVDLNDMDPLKLAQLPNWSDVTALYGSDPVYVGLETCQTFQNNLSIDPAEHFVTTAGTFNTGTNLMAELLISNCQIKARVKKYGPSQKGVRWQAIWGKSL